MKEIIGFEENKKLPTGSCFFGHKWSKWETYKADKLYFSVEYKELRQKRYCIKCNKLQTRDC